MKSLKLTWALPTTRTDGAPVAASEIIGTRVEISADNGENFSELDVVSAPDSELTVPNLEAGNYIFRFTALDGADEAKNSAASDFPFQVEPPVGATAPLSPVSGIAVTVLP